MLDGTASTIDATNQLTDAHVKDTSQSLLRKLIWLYVWGSAVAVVVTFFLVFVGLEFTFRQWMLLFLVTPFIIPVYVIPDIFMIARHYRPIKAIVERLDSEELPTPQEVSPAVVRALNLPFYSFLRVTFMHGPMATVTLLAGLLINNQFFDAQYADWQVAGFALTVLFFASPTHAIFEFFAISRILGPTYLRLWTFCPRLEEVDRQKLVSINLKQKLLYLAIFLTALPLLFFAISIFFQD